MTKDQTQEQEEDKTRDLVMGDFTMLKIWVSAGQ